MREIINCAVLGLGRLGYWHAENLASKIKGVKLAYVVDTQENHAKEVAEKLGIKQWSIDPQTVFNDPDIDAVIIATPTSTHAEMIIKAAQKGKHIFVEKPMTHDLEEADKVIKTIQENNVICQVGFMRRFDSAYAEAKKRILAGDIGKPMYFKSVSRDPGSPPPKFIKHSGGIFLDMCIHDYDIARYLMDDEICSIHAHGNILIHPFMKEYNDVDQAITYMQFKSGAAGDIEGSRNSAYGYDIRSEVLGTEGSILISTLKHHDIKILTSKGATYDIVPGFPEKFKDSYLSEMTHFIECVQRGQKPIVNEVDGKIALLVSVAARTSFEQKREVIVKG